MAADSSCSSDVEDLPSHRPQELEPNAGTAEKPPMPLWMWPMPFLALAATSTAAPLMRAAEEVPPILRAGWRQQLTALVVLPAAIWEYRQMSPDLRARLWSARVLGRLACSGSILGLHFGLYIWGLDHTTLAHTTLLVCSSPLILAAGRVVLRFPIQNLEMGGTLLGFGGVIVSVAGELRAPAAGADGSVVEEVRLSGDAAALAGAFSVVGYILIGSELRQWMPTTVYVAPVFSVSAAVLTAVAVGIEGAGAEGGVQPCGWASARWITPFLLLALIPGVCGHTVMNLCLSYWDPLSMTLIQLLLPVVSSVLGWAIGVSGMPGMWTAAGGPITLAGCAVAAVGARRRELAARGAGMAAHGAMRLADDDVAATAEKPFARAQQGRKGSGSSDEEAAARPARSKHQHASLELKPVTCGSESVS